VKSSVPRLRAVQLQLQLRQTVQDMELISHEEFGRLRLVDFSREATEIEDWEYLDRLWIGEAIGFSEWLRPVEKPDVLGALSLDLSDLPDEMSQKIFAVLRLPLSRGMNYSQVVSVLGEPTHSQQFTSGQTTYEFQCGNQWPYEIDCTVQNEDGLSYVTVVAK
jgi:hypothetical protein